MQDLGYIQVMRLNKLLQETNLLRDVHVGNGILSGSPKRAVEQFGHDILLQALERVVDLLVGGVGPERVVPDGAIHLREEGLDLAAVLLGVGRVEGEGDKEALDGAEEVGGGGAAHAVEEVVEVGARRRRRGALHRKATPAPALAFDLADKPTRRRAVTGVVCAGTPGWIPRPAVFVGPNGESTR